MPKIGPDLQPLIDEITNSVGVMNSATVEINGVLTRIEAANAISQTAVTEEIAKLRAAADPLAAAVAANPDE